MTTQHPASIGVKFSIVVAAALLACSPIFADDLPEGFARSAAPELKKLRALLVIDTAAEELKESITQDRKNVEMVLKAYIPETMRGDVTVLEGRKATKKAILDHYRKLPMLPDETLLFFYAGHGGMDKGDHILQLQKGDDPILRKDIVQAMKNKKPGLIVLLTDCCSSKTRMTSKISGAEKGVLEERQHPVLRCLFFQHRGIVDITAAQDNTGSYGDQHGGVFTRSLCSLLRDDLKDLDKNKDNFLSWKEFFEKLQQKTEDTFEKYCETVRATEKTDIKKTQKTQKPRAFGLAQPMSVVVAKNENKTFAVVTLVNRTGKPLAYRYRWAGEDRWEDGKMEKNGKMVHKTIVKGNPASSQLPRLEVDIPSEKSKGELRALKWTGAGEPSDKDGNEIELSAGK